MSHDALNERRQIVEFMRRVRDEGMKTPPEEGVTPENHELFQMMLKHTIDLLARCIESGYHDSKEQKH